MIETGTLDDLIPENYHPDITGASPEGFIPEVERDEYFVSWNYSPPPFTYGAINWNIASVPDYDAVVQTVLELKNETAVTRVRKYVSVGTALKPEEHEAMHSKLPESQVEHPHSFLFHPVHEDVTDYNSRIVGILVCGVAWDASLLNLLPDNVDGIHAVIKNNCDQAYTYEINGPEAIFMGEGDNHERKFDDHECACRCRVSVRERVWA